MKMRHGSILTNFFLCLIFVVWLLAPDRAQAWDAVPHMIVGAIARLNMSELAQSKIDYILGLWRGQYPRQSTLERACTWLKTIQLKEGANTDVTRRFDFIQLFQGMHGVDFPWNPHKIKVQGILAELPIYERTALYLLDNAYKSLLMTTTSMKKFEDPYCTVPAVPDLLPSKIPAAVQLAAATGSGEVAVGQSHAISEQQNSTQNYSSSTIRRRPSGPPQKRKRDSSEKPGGIGSILSLNLHLRIILHLMADIHQPLHTVFAHYSAFPTGDKGGNNITMVLPGRTQTTLHRFWDSAAFLYTKSAGEVSDEEILKEALELQKEYPISRLLENVTSSLLAPHFYNIAKETFGLATSVVYRELNLAKLKFSDLPYLPSGEYIVEARAISKQQLALAGYRLAHCLEIIAKYLPYPGFKEQDLGNSEIMSDEDSDDTGTSTGHT